ncbi:MAG: type II toxin-antitoxin system RelE/ParE family toxin [Methylovulum miyakonense]|uniref:type II toxin-antitoxin system RelE/ParE family toxin n=1 Tax=Methylovulum miyakonense TaxID=645578 RepID=UPI003BB7E105
MRKIEFIPEAREEFLAEVAFYQAKQHGLGGKFSSAVEKAVALVAAFPDVGSPSASGTRRVVIKGFPFWLVYQLAQTDAIVIFAIAHHSRRPGYWLDRLS